MATSDSDDFESADEELVAHDATSRKPSVRREKWQNVASTIDSESDDDHECIPNVSSGSTVWNSGNHSVQTSGQERRVRSFASGDDTPGKMREEETKRENSSAEKKDRTEAETGGDGQKSESSKDTDGETSFSKEDSERKSDDKSVAKSSSVDVSSKRERRQKKPKEAKSLGTKKLGSKVTARTAPRPPPPPEEDQSPDEARKKALAEGKEPPVIEECWEFDEEETAKILHGLGDVDKVKMPEELRSDKKFREIFKPDGWEGLEDETILSELEDDKIRPVLEKIADNERANASWGSWGSWGVSSLINSATAGVTTLTSHVTHGLTLLDEAMGAPNPEELEKNDLTDDTDAIEADKTCTNREIQPQVSFGFNDLLSGVSSITKLVESTGTKVITGGLGTLETIGKKTMEVLQDGDPGLKKKRAFFMNEIDKPILSKILREAKEKAEFEEKNIEDKQALRKVHFESLFDDYQGLVHLEALEMLSKQCNMKIQQRLVVLDTDELTSLQETLEEVKELCDLGDDDDDDDENNDGDNNLQERLEAACKDLGVSITYEKLNDIWKDTRTYVTEISSNESTITERQVFQRAISTLARFTAFSVERFHKTAELLLIKERRSTVNEADALVQLAQILSRQIGIAANIFSNWLNERFKETQKPDGKVDITTIFLEAANASSYIQDAFRLLIPILQVGAI